MNPGVLMIEAVEVSLVVLIKKYMDWISFNAFSNAFIVFQIVASFDCLVDFSADSYSDDSAYSYQQNTFLIDCFVAQSNSLLYGPALVRIYG